MQKAERKKETLCSCSKKFHALRFIRASHLHKRQVKGSSAQGRPRHLSSFFPVRISRTIAQVIGKSTDYVPLIMFDQVANAARVVGGSSTELIWLPLQCLRVADNAVIN